MHVQVEMVADVVCPFCYMGLAHLEKALSNLTSLGGIEVVFTPFILRRELPKSGVVIQNMPGGDLALHKVSKHVEADGLAFDKAGQRFGNSEDAHRLLMWAGTDVLPLFQKMAVAYNSKGQWLGDHERLIATVRAVPQLSVPDARRVLLDRSAYSGELEAGLQRAHKLGVQSLPAFFVNGVALAEGAVPAEDLHRAMVEALQCMSYPRRNVPGPVPAPAAWMWQKAATEGVVLRWGRGWARKSAADEEDQSTPTTQ
jgi:predicted DsbA family dithiol-disulfide isomerase